MYSLDFKYYTFPNNLDKALHILNLKKACRESAPRPIKYDADDFVVALAFWLLQLPHAAVDEGWQKRRSKDPSHANAPLRL